MSARLDVMPLDTAPADFDSRYRALAARDTRFDGQWYVTVASTGIYCRPSCPARTPRPENVDFVPTAAAAVARGFRACRRCLPDSAPGSPQWNLGADLASRAMRLISDGLVDRAGVDGLAAALGYTPRHLNRVLTAELGAGPLALARAHRATTARILLVNTAMPVGDVAFAAGFASIRQFNDSIRETYDLTPTELRSKHRGALPVASTTAGSLTLRLPLRLPYNTSWTARGLSAHAIAGMEHWDGETFTRTLSLPHGPALAALTLPFDKLRTSPFDGAQGAGERAQGAGGQNHKASERAQGAGGQNHEASERAQGAGGQDHGAGGQAQGAVTARFEHLDLRDLAVAVNRLRRLVDLDADPRAVDDVLGADPRLAPLVAAAPGIRLPGSVDGFETLMRVMAWQQISLAAARTRLGNLVVDLGERAPWHDDARPDVPSLLFPTAESFAERGAEAFRGPRRQAAALVGAAEAVAEHRVEPHPGSETSKLRADLLALPGVGPWTADLTVMRVTGDPDVLPRGDLLIDRAAADLGIDSADAERWRPWRSYAAMHLWRHQLTGTTN